MQLLQLYILLIVFHIDGDDYEVLNENPIEIGPGTYKDLSVDAVNDEIVESLNEYFIIRLYEVRDPNVHISEARNYTKVTIHDDDSKYIQYSSTKT